MSTEVRYSFSDTVFGFSLTICVLDAILSTITLAQLLSSLKKYHGHFRFEAFQKAKSTRQIYCDISRHRLSLTSETGIAIGEMAKAVQLDKDYLEHFVHLIIAEWKIKGTNWRNDNTFVEAVRKGFDNPSMSSSQSQHENFDHFMKSLEGFLSANASVGETDSALSDSLEGDSGLQGTSWGKEQTMASNGLDKDHDQSAQKINSEPDHDAVKQETDDSKTHNPGRWRDIEGFGPWTMRVFDLGSKIDVD